MKAVICEKYGPPEVLKIKEIEKPRPRRGEILIDVKATSVNSGDVRLRALRVGDGVLGVLGKYIMMVFIGFRGPRRKVLGVVLSGIVEELGDDVDAFKVGDEVFAMTGMRFGAFAEYAVLPQDKGIALKPKNASFEEAAALPFGGTTAIYFLRKAGLVPQKKVLIYGSTGAVGTSAVQIAKAAGADVTAVSGEDGTLLSKSLGASRVYDYKKKKVSEINDSFDIIFDAVGKISKNDCEDILTTGGSYVTVAGLDVAQELKSDMEQIANMYDNGSLKAVIDRTYTLDEMVEAHRYVDTGHKKGNVVVTV